jgi:hypothetical protein
MNEAGEKAAQARKKVLDEIRARLWEKAFPPFGSSPEYQIITWDTVKEVIESLCRREVQE